MACSPDEPIPNAIGAVDAANLAAPPRLRAAGAVAVVEAREVPDPRVAAMAAS